jgi:hypothetical protein
VQTVRGTCKHQERNSSREDGGRRKDGLTALLAAAKPWQFHRVVEETAQSLDICNGVGAVGIFRQAGLHN